MLKCVEKILRIIGIENRKSSAGARVVINDFTDWVSRGGQGQG